MSLTTIGGHSDLEEAPIREARPFLKILVSRNLLAIFKLSDNRRGNRNQRYDSGRYTDNASPNMMPSSGNNGRRHYRSSGDGGHISPQGNYGPSRNGGGAAMDAPGNYRMASDYDYDNQSKRHYNEAGRRMRKSNDRHDRNNYKRRSDNERYDYDRMDMNRSRLSGPDSLRSNQSTIPSRNPLRSGQSQGGTRGSRDSIMRDSFSPGP